MTNIRFLYLKNHDEQIIQNNMFWNIIRIDIGKHFILLTEGIRALKFKSR